MTEEICAICREGENAKKLSCCNHLLHDECITEYFMKNQEKKIECLLCRKEFEVYYSYNNRTRFLSFIRPLIHWIFIFDLLIRIINGSCNTKYEFVLNPYPPSLWYVTTRPARFHFLIFTTIIVGMLYLFPLHINLFIAEKTYYIGQLGNIICSIVWCIYLSLALHEYHYPEKLIIM